MARFWDDTFNNKIDPDSHTTSEEGVVVVVPPTIPDPPIVEEGVVVEVVVPPTIPDLQIVEEGVVVVPEELKILPHLSTWSACIPLGSLSDSRNPRSSQWTPPHRQSGLSLINLLRSLFFPQLHLYIYCMTLFLPANLLFAPELYFVPLKQVPRCWNCVLHTFLPASVQAVCQWSTYSNGPA